MNRTLKGILTAYVNKDHNDWDDHLPLALFAYRNSVHSSSGVSPFQAIYGREATTPLVLMDTETEVKEQFISNYCDELEKTLKDVHRSIKTNIDVAQSKQKKGYDEHNDVDRSTALKEGDRVWLNNKAVPKGLSRKFHSPWTGPYVVIKRLGKVNYHIKPGPGNGKTRVVHRNRLKLDIRQPRIEETLSVDQPEKHNSRVELLPGEPVIHHGERLADAQLLPAEELIQLRRSNRNRRQPDRYQDYNLDELEIEDALN
ncbi:Retrovirus-related Pol poly from transposon 412 [Paramuricea clavata]|uniref:Retrovirus-related Pol poly from transposon 412 n=1 Tax=Paramuricea clavata TaxID=317549 RepID=A0A6S7K2M9_PARCT|nr:Retrovirus-related Pol poly from transposon 412 [Paramuricea clavata]